MYDDQRQGESFKDHGISWFWFPELPHTRYPGGEFGELCSQVCRFLFLHRWDDEKCSLMAAGGKRKVELDTVSGVTGWTLHDLRRTFATSLAKLGVSQLVVEKPLNHSVGNAQSDLAAICNRYSYELEMRDAFGRLEAHIANLLER